ncbi:MAG TPA: hypothetical protein VMJ10_23550 [Kofleriaceae bacterium]|nr:hypothetical protein [Kofleriaceae bacterium]
MNRYLVIAALAACNWTTFDDLQQSTWVDSQKVPSGVGSTDYALAIAPLSGTGSAGSLAVLSGNAAWYSQLDFDAKGNASNGYSSALADDNVTQLAPQPLFVADDTGNFALVQSGDISTPISIVYGPAAGPLSVAQAFPGSADAATFVKTSLVIASGQSLITVTFNSGGAMAQTMTCMAEDPSGMAVAGIAAIGTDATVDNSPLYAWTTDGKLLSFALPLSSMPACLATATIFTATGFQPAPGSRLFAYDGHAVLVGVDTNSNGQVFVADTTMTAMSGAAALSVTGLASSTLGGMGTSGEFFLALGYPNRAVNGVTSGQVELYNYEQTKGTLGAGVAETLENAEPANGQLFGRDLAVMPYNGVGVLAVSAHAELFVYYQTLEYPDDTRQH